MNPPPHTPPPERGNPGAPPATALVKDPHSLRRDPGRLAGEQFDLVVIGGGILGACVARDAALRGLKTALVEKGDFGSGTSANSLKILHGGLRYLQQLNFKGMRESIRERSIWLRTAPHLTEPLPVVVPTYGHGLAGREILRLALAVNDVVSWDRNRDLEAERRLPPGRSLSRRECLDLVPECDRPGLTGGVQFYDAQMYSAERLVLAVVQAASAAGVVADNYVEVEVPLLRNGKLEGVRARDRLSGGALEVRGRLLINAAGPQAMALAARLLGRTPRSAPARSLAMNLVLPGQGHRVAFALPGAAVGPAAVARGGGRHLFFAPWRGRMLAGTAHYPHDGAPGRPAHSEADIRRFLGEVNQTWPGKPFGMDDVQLVHAGLLPAHPGRPGDEVRLVRRHQVVDHATDGADGFLSVLSVKFTTARLAAEEAVSLAVRKLGVHAPGCRTHVAALPGAERGAIPILAEVYRQYGDLLERDILEHLVRIYGDRYERVLAWRQVRPDWSERLDPAAPVIKAQFLHAVAEEMGDVPADLVARRTELGARGLPCAPALAFAASLLPPSRTLPDTERASACQ